MNFRRFSHCFDVVEISSNSGSFLLLDFFLHINIAVNVVNTKTTHHPSIIQIESSTMPSGISHA